MARTKTSLTISNGNELWGLVTLTDAAGNVLREYPITGAQLRAVKAGGVPPLMTKATWETGRAVVEGRPCLRGMLYARPDGSAIVNLGRRTVGQRIEQRRTELPANKWGVTAQGEVEVDDDVLDLATPDPTLTD